MAWIQSTVVSEHGLHSRVHCWWEWRQGINNSSSARPSTNHSSSPSAGHRHGRLLRSSRCWGGDGGGGSRSGGSACGHALGPRAGGTDFTFAARHLVLALALFACTSVFVVYADGAATRKGVAERAGPDGGRSWGEVAELERHETKFSNQVICNRTYPAAGKGRGRMQSWADRGQDRAQDRARACHVHTCMCTLMSHTYVHVSE